MEQDRRSGAPDRILGDEWLDWRGIDEPPRISEGKRTFLLLSLAVLAIFLFLGFLFWYLVLPRFEQYGHIYAVILTIAVAAAAIFFLVWYALLIGAVVSHRIYLAICLRGGSNLFLMLFPVVARLARSFGISRDRVSHSFIEVTNTLVTPPRKSGPVLALLPRCLAKEQRAEIRKLCDEFPDVVIHTAPGGTEARRIIHGMNPRAIVAVACERDLVSGIHDVLPKIPVIGIPNTRPLGPCKDTAIDVDKLKSALAFFCR